jgi:hypothetical protein
MSINIEDAVVGWLQERLGIPVSADVPVERPDGRFVTVERTGGDGIYRAIDNPDLAIQCWAPTRLDASGLAYEVDSVLPDLVEIPGVSRCVRNSLYNFPDDKGKPRYQIVVNLTTTL